MSKNYEQAKPDPVREISAEARDEQIRLWAALGVAAMLARVRRVCITEYQWKIDDLRSG